MKSIKFILLGIYLSLSFGMAQASTLLCQLPDEKPITIELNLPALTIKHQVQNTPAITTMAKVSQSTLLTYMLTVKSYQLNLKTLTYNRFQKGKPTVNGSCNVVYAGGTQPTAPTRTPPPVIPAKPNGVPHYVRSPTIPQPIKPSRSTYTCGAKHFCKQMTSCEEAKFYLTQCGLSKLDKDGDGRPCENVCGK